MKGGLCERNRNGTGLQEWPDGSKYEGEFVNGVKHGSGTFTWANGESYKGSFYKDYRHGSGTYSWTDGSQFTGKFYLNRKEGYGVHLFPDGTTFRGLYYADERCGPGVMSYPDGRQDVGLWYRQWLLCFCTVIEGGFSLRDFPEHRARLPLQHIKLTQTQPQLFDLPFLTTECSTENKQFFSEDTLLLDDPSLLEDERFILPPGIETYSTDSDHLPVPRRLRQELDMHFFNRNDIKTSALSNDLPLRQRMKAHIHTHRFQVEELDWDVGAVLAMNRNQFGPRGPLEHLSEGLIREASLGDLHKVQHMLRDGGVHPDVADARGYTALIAATVNCRYDVIHLLLDSGADVNKLNDEGMSALAVCSVLFYPLQSLHETVAERSPQKSTTKPEIRTSSILTPLSTQEGESLGGTDSQTDHIEKDPSPERFISSADLEAQEPTVESETLNDNEENPQIAQSTEVEVLEAEISEDAEPLNDSFAWHRSEEGSENDFSTLDEQVGWRNGSSVEDCGLDSTSSMASFRIDVTEDVIQQMAEILCKSGQVSPVKTVHKMALLKTERQAHWVTMKLLLERGADPNASCTPMPVIFLSIKAGHVEAVQRLLECGARTDLHLPAEQKALYPLHLAAGLPGPEGPKITELLLYAVADADVKAQDANEVFELDKNTVEAQVDYGDRSSLGSGLQTSIYPTYTEAPEEGGRTPLHVACQRLTDYTNARDAVSILLAHKASTNHLWSGHSPLSLAIASGNDLAVDELLAAGADPDLPLSRSVGSALCAAVNIHYDWGPHPLSRVKLVEKLIKAGANILMPVLVGEGRRRAVGTAVDYAHYSFNQDSRIVHTPYCVSSQRKREIYNSRCQLLTMMGDLLRQAAVNMEKERLENEQSLGIHSVSPTEKFVFTGTAATRVHRAEEGRTWLNEPVAQQRCTPKIRKPLFKFCYQCGRSAWVALKPCSRCREVFYCSTTCKMKAWNERHKEECVRVPGSERCKGVSSGHRQNTRSAKSSRKGKDLHLKLDKPNANKQAPHAIAHLQSPEENYSFI